MDGCMDGGWMGHGWMDTRRERPVGGCMGE